MRYLHRHWYNLSAFIGIVIFSLLFVFWNDATTLQKFAIANLGVIFFHFFEEFGFPGGFGKLANTLYYTNSPDATRWPLNQNSVMIGNWSFALLFYVPPIFFPNIIWLGLIPMLFGAVGQMLAHGFINNIKLKQAGLKYGYNSGLITALFGHVPLCIFYGIYIEDAGMATGWDWGLGFLGSVLAYVVVFRMIIMKSLENKDSPYPFDSDEMHRFDKLYGRDSK